MFSRFVYILLCFLMIHCGSPSQILGGTETGNTEAGAVDSEKIGNRFQIVSSALIPSIDSVSNSNSNLNFSNLISYQSSSDWDIFLENDTVITDVFAAPNEGDDVVTKLRVILRNSGSSLQSIFNTDADLNCLGASELNVSTTIELPFLGEFSNGTVANPRFSCVKEQSGQTEIYGQGEDEVFRWALMDDGTSANTEMSDVRGSQVNASQIIYVEYAESNNLNSTEVFISLQYVQATIYSGVDDIFGTNDDVTFKSRTLIVGNANVTSEEVVGLATGDFLVTSTGQSPNQDNNPISVTTKTIGRGSYGEDEYSIFRIHSDVSEELTQAQGYFCLQHNESSNPQSTESSNCESVETDFAWGTTSFPFTIVSTINQDFEQMEFFENNDTDLIANDGSNFMLPDYAESAP